MKKIFLVLIVAVACSKENTDMEKPAIQISSPVNGVEYLVGCDTCALPVRATISDNDELNACKIEAHSAAGHGSHVSLMKALTASWLYDTIIDAKGNKKIELSLSISLKEVQDTGEFHFLIYATDKSGNESLAERDIFFRLSAQ